MPFLLAVPESFHPDDIPTSTVPVFDLSDVFLCGLVAPHSLEDGLGIACNATPRAHDWSVSLAPLLAFTSATTCGYRVVVAALQELLDVLSDCRNRPLMRATWTPVQKNEAILPAQAIVSRASVYQDIECLS